MANPFVEGQKFLMVFLRVRNSRSLVEGQKSLMLF